MRAGGRAGGPGPAAAPAAGRDGQPRSAAGAGAARRRQLGGQRLGSGARFQHRGCWTAPGGQPGARLRGRAARSVSPARSRAQRQPPRPPPPSPPAPLEHAAAAGGQQHRSCAGEPVRPADLHLAAREASGKGIEEEEYSFSFYFFFFFSRALQYVPGEFVDIIIDWNLGFCSCAWGGEREKGEKKEHPPPSADPPCSPSPHFFFLPLRWRFGHLMY